jgi:hypothetical protein
MSYGSPEWQPWVLGEEEGIKHIKAAFDLGINTFDTANVCFLRLTTASCSHYPRVGVLERPLRGDSWQSNQAAQPPA